VTIPYHGFAWPSVAMHVPHRLPQLLVLLAVASVACGCVDEACEAESASRSSQDPQVRRACTKLPRGSLGAGTGSLASSCAVTHDQGTGLGDCTESEDSLDWLDPEILHAYRVLGLKPGATKAEIEKVRGAAGDTRRPPSHGVTV
jgi:hypothetical protein